MAILESMVMVLSLPLLWWLVSVMVVIWAVLTINVGSRPQLIDRVVVLLLVFASATLGGDIYVALGDELLNATVQDYSISTAVTGGKASIGAIIGAGIAVLTYLYVRKIPFLSYADKIIPYAALSYAVARVGCFANGDDFGVVSGVPWAVTFYPATEAYSVHMERGWISMGAAHSLSVHPTQLYHAMSGLAGFLLLRSWIPGWKGSRLALALVYYGIARFVIQFYRDDHAVAGSNIDAAQWFGLVLVLIGLALCTSNWYRSRKTQFKPLSVRKLGVHKKKLLGRQDA